MNKNWKAVLTVLFYNYAVFIFNPMYFEMKL